uniref:Uncharacterized protein n=1 Tax=Chenopodium quinoa TaxID=63459 RepID=A0A803ND88_CHEQI
MKAMDESSFEKKDESLGEAQPSDSANSSNRKGKKRKSEEVFQNELLFIKEGLDNVTLVIVERGRAQVYSPQEVFEELSKMEIDSLTRRKAYRFLNAKQSRIRELFGCPPEERKDYLIEMMLDEEN